MAGRIHIITNFSKPKIILCNRLIWNYFHIMKYYYLHFKMDHSEDEMISRSNLKSCIAKMCNMHKDTPPCWYHVQYGGHLFPCSSNLRLFSYFKIIFPRHFDKFSQTIYCFSFSNLFFNFLNFYIWTINFEGFPFKSIFRQKNSNHPSYIIAVKINTHSIPR